jgi:carbonic anhydrase/acetyltransferase-like protein (isoleucine patch superfamily)
MFGENCSVWFNAVIRGDVNFITIGNKVNIQDGAVIHCTYKKHPTIIGNMFYWPQRDRTRMYSS